MIKASLHGDRMLPLTAAVLVGLGLLMIYSSSSIIAFERYGDSLYFFKRQLFMSLIGFVGMMFFAGISLDVLKRATNYLGVAIFIMLVVVLIPGLGVKVHGAQRWVSMGTFSIQPSEFAKLALVIFLAGSIGRRGDMIRDLKRGVGPYFALMVIIFLMVNMQPDLGTAVTTCLIVYAMLFLAGARISHLLLPVLFAIPAFYFCVVNVDYRWKRIASFFDPFDDPQGGGFQIIQSFIALGTGGIYGIGLGNSAQKLFYLPEPHTDFIFAILGEEFGLLGTLVFLVLYGFLFFRGVSIARRAPNMYAFLLASGLTVMITSQILMNLGVVTGLLPTKGMTLPLMSYGGSSLVVSLCLIGLLMNVSKLSEESRYTMGEA